MSNTEEVSVLGETVFTVGGSLLVDMKTAWVDLSRYETIKITRDGTQLATVRVDRSSNDIVFTNADGIIIHTIKGGC